MKQDDLICVPLSFKYLMSALFGKDNYHGYVGVVERSTWKKDLRKIIKYVRKSIKLSVDADQFHKSRIISICLKLDKKLSKADTTSQMNIIIIESLIKLVFNLIGHMPDHWRRRSPYADRFWELDGHRRLSYNQSDEQKSYLIINLIDIRKDFEIELEEYEDLHAVFYLYRKFKSKAQDFVRWFKRTYPKIYCEIF